MKMIWKALTIFFISILITFLLVLFESNNTLHNSITGIKLNKKEIFSHHSERAWNGDGYSIQIFEITDESIDQLIKSKHEFLDGYPKPDNDRKHWNKIYWSKSPLQKEELIYHNFALSGLQKKETTIFGKIENLDNYINSMLAEKENYYAYFYYLHPERNVGNIDFFILSPKKRILIVINHNT